MHLLYMSVLSEPLCYAVIEQVYAVKAVAAHMCTQLTCNGCVCRGAVKGSLMVHDEEAEVSIRLATLIANSLHGRPAIPLLDNHAQELSAGRAHTAQGKYYT